jgi:hypothetical protein
MYDYENKNVKIRLINSFKVLKIQNYCKKKIKKILVVKLNFEIFAPIYGFFFNL